MKKYRYCLLRMPEGLRATRGIDVGYARHRPQTENEIRALFGHKLVP